MPKLRKRNKRSTDETENLADTSVALPAPTTARTRSLQYRHYAANVRYSDNDNNNTQEDLAETSLSTTNVVKVRMVMVALLVICFGRTPHWLLRFLLFGEMAVCEFPEFFPNWVISIAIILPMEIQSRIGAFIGFAIFSWISNLDWTYAWERVVHAIVFGQADHSEIIVSQV